MKGNGFNIMMNAKSLVEHERRLKRSYGGGIHVDYDHATMKEAFLSGLIPLPATDRSEKLCDAPLKLVRCKYSEDGTLLKAEDKGVVEAEANSTSILPTEQDLEDVRDIVSAPWISTAVDRVISKHKKSDAPIMASEVKKVRNSALDSDPKMSGASAVSRDEAIAMMDNPIEEATVRKPVQVKARTVKPPVESVKVQPAVPKRSRNLADLLGTKR